MYVKATFSICPRLILWILLRENLGSDSVATERFKKYFWMQLLCWVSDMSREIFLLWRLDSLGFPGGPVDKESTCNSGEAGDMASIPGPERSPGGGHGNPLQYSCLENPMDRGAWWATVHSVEKSWIWLKRWGTHARMDSLVGVPGLSSWGTWVQKLWSTWDPSSLIRDRAHVPGAARRILNHWITREVPWVFSLRETSVRWNPVCCGFRMPRLLHKSYHSWAMGPLTRCSTPPVYSFFTIK